MKVCVSCKKKKPMAMFYKHKNMADGRLSKCKECKLDYAKDYRKENLERVRSYDLKRARNPERIAAYKAYRKTKKGRQVKHKAVKKWSKNNPEKVAAQRKYRAAVASGKIKKEPCFICFEEKAEGHHPDYSKPLLVMWVCSPCHKMIHKYERKKEKVLKNGICT